MSKFKLIVKDMESFKMKEQFFYIHNEGRILGGAKHKNWKITVYRMRGLYAVAWYNPKKKEENHIIWKSTLKGAMRYLLSAGIKPSYKIRPYEKTKPGFSPSKYRLADLFHKKMVAYTDEYRTHLLRDKSQTDIQDRLNVIQGFSSYLFSHLISDLDEITVSMANSRFHSYYNRQFRESVRKQFFKSSLKAFFIFIYGKHGIKNQIMMDGFDK